jgi:hypothetical protein
LGCRKTHPATKSKLKRGLELKAKVKESGLCLFCVRHSVEAECSGKDISIKSA